MELDFEAVRALLPQRYPFLMVDRVTSLEKGTKIVVLKNITGNEPQFPGHFPSMAIMPGVLILESMAQAAIILFSKSAGETNPNNGNTLFFLGAAKARFFQPVVPGDQLQVELNVVKTISKGGIVEGLATVAGRRVAKAELTFGAKDISEVETVND